MVIDGPFEAVIGCMGDVDAYLLPDAKGYQAMLRHLLGEDDEYRQKVRDQHLGPVHGRTHGETNKRWEEVEEFMQ